MTKDNFDKLLEWLDEDREAAAQKYYSIHRRLVKFYLGRKMFPANELADDTIDRVSRKTDYLIENFEGDQANYFYKVAKMICLEYLKPSKEVPLEQDFVVPEPEPDEFEGYYECLEKCMNRLSDENREIIVKYTQYSKKTKVRRRKNLTKNLDISIDLLRVKVFRIKKILRKCVNNCLKQEKV